MRQFIFLTLLVFGSLSAQTDNQTVELSPIFPNKLLPFTVRIELADFALPNGIQGNVLGRYKGKWLLFDGRTNGVHGFDSVPINFPVQMQNLMVYVVDPDRKKVYQRSIDDPLSGLTQDQIDSLSVVSPQYYQEGNTLYVTGGYGFKKSLNNYTTFPILSAIDVPGLMRWVAKPKPGETAAEHIRQISNPIFQITGGDSHKVGKHHPTLLPLGNDFEGTYHFNATQVYSNQIRRFHVIDDGVNLDVEVLPSYPATPDPNLRRRDLNVLPVIKKSHGKLVKGLVALSGVFTEDSGIWTVPVEITADGVPFMANPADPTTFKQGMNNYVSPTIGLYSKRHDEMYLILFGGISFGFFQDGKFTTDDEDPFINQVTTVKIDKKGHYTQYLMDSEFPAILSTTVNPGNVLLFGANGLFIPANSTERLRYDNDVFKLDRISKPIFIGYIIGGIQSTVPNTTSITDSSASPYIFKVFFEPKKKCRK